MRDRACRRNSRAGRCRRLPAEWGLSLHLESEKRGASAQYLLDFGYTPEIVNRNLGLLDIEPARLNGLILSHGHRDHYGGLAGFVTQHRHRMRARSRALCRRGECLRGEMGARSGRRGPVSWGTLDHSLLKAENVAPVCCGHPHALEGAFTSGYIDAQFLRGSHRRHVGRAARSFHRDAERRGQLVKDLHPEEHATCYIVQGRGLVVISSCGHAGIINSVRDGDGGRECRQASRRDRGLSS